MKGKEEIEFFEKIESYFEGTLSEPEIEALKKNLVNNPELAKEAEIDSIIIEALKNHELQNIKDDVDKAMNIVKGAVEPFKKKRRQLFPFLNPILKIAAVISILIISAVVISKYIQSISIDKVIISYLEKPYQSPAFYKAPEKSSENWKKAYQSGKYIEAKIALQNVVRLDSSNIEAKFYLGLCYLYQTERDPTNAIDQFNEVLTVKSRYDEQSIWYLGLSYYLAGDKQSAITTLEKVRGNKLEEAATILKRLK